MGVGGFFKFSPHRKLPVAGERPRAEPDRRREPIPGAVVATKVSPEDLLNLDPLVYACLLRVRVPNARKPKSNFCPQVTIADAARERYLAQLIFDRKVDGFAASVSHAVAFIAADA